VTFELVLIGLVITLEPIPLISFLVIVSSRRGVVKGAAFILGWLVSLAIVIAVTVLATGNKPPKPNTAPSLASLAVKILIGVVLLLVALRQYRRRGRPKKEKKTPKWQAGVDNMSPLYAFGVAFLVQPWGLVAAGIADIVEAKLSSWESYLAVILFCLITVSSMLTIEIYAGFWPEQCQRSIVSIRSWIDTHTDQVIIVGSTVLGFWLIGKSTYLLVS
jgi:threonine/homoserine/homoserine lactone efflux protein